MISRALRVARAAEQQIGTCFRFHGRDPCTGIDCIGLILASLTKADLSPPNITGYSLRNLQIGRWLCLVEKCGLQQAKGELRAGDVLLLRISPVQFHCGIISEGGSLIHAHAGLARVVCTPMPLQWPVEYHWRLIEG